ncbi:MAG: ATP phosphoribosyltransferase regulatory subunit [Calditerrivibrio sp.]|nr:ATP phosphoribosyltransferase regulatory subunit [Calditerrivibrio sp.]MCA1932282.1 ATP phosphoribosyltransferase regulatory subunit [Calditerrivibrio sp.]
MTNLSAIERAKMMNAIIGKISDIISLYGYSEIFLPIYEYYDVLADKTFNFNDEKIIRFIDRNTGKSLVLRPDFTPQVCRIVANYLSDMPLPIRLSYSGRIFRNVGAHKGIKSEKYQIGCELFGSDEYYGDLELLLISRRVLNDLGIEDYRIIVGDKKFISMLSEFVNMENFIKMLETKSVSAIEYFLSNVKLDDRILGLLKFLPDAFGGRDILDKIEELSEFSPILTERIRYIKSLIGKFQELGGDIDRVVFDIGETRGLNYYTGVNIDIVSRKDGSSLGGGGRYDTLMEKFGYGISASGIAFNIEEILRFSNLAYDEKKSSVLNISSIEEAEKLRDNGKEVFLLSKHIKS